MKRANWILGTFVVLLLVPAIYLLSLGPAMGLYSRDMISDAAFEGYYTPLSKCCAGIDDEHWFARGLTAYMTLWIPADWRSNPADSP
ncbi:MAG: hypothetical protein IAF94_10255 [Pirellulaceae bacterium]|nr:hypothetical protein [Pirellulaceae bacterium]